MNLKQLIAENWGLILGCYFSFTAIALPFSMLDCDGPEERLHTCGKILLWPLFLVTYFAKAFIVGVNDFLDYALDAIKTIVSN